MNRKKYIFEKLIPNFLKALISCLFAGGAIYCWLNYFNQETPMPYYRLGNYFLFALVLASYVFIAKIYGAFQIGTSTATDVAFSQVISVFIWQIVCYALFSLVSFKLVSVKEFFIMFVIFSAFGAMWAVIADTVYFMLHKPKKTIVVYDNIDSYISLKGIRSMDRRFDVVKTVAASKTEPDELFAVINGVDAVFLCGVPPRYFS